MPLQNKTAEKMLNNVAEFIAATQAKPDQRAWDQLLIYCPREAIERRASTLSSTHKAPEDNCSCVGAVIGSHDSSCPLLSTHSEGGK